MADTQGKHSVPRAQGRRRAHAATKPPASPKPKAKTRKRTRRIPRLPKPIITNRRNTTIRRYNGRRFYHFEEVKRKTVDYVEVFTAAEYHSIYVPFQGNTAMH